MPPGITVVGLGPGNPALLTLEAQQVLSQVTELYLRTRQHPTVAHLSRHLVLHSFDHIYEQQETFDQVYAEITRQVLELGRRPEGVCYAVPGHPLVGEATVWRLLAEAPAAGLSVRLVAGMSFFEPIFQALRLDPLEGMQILDATELALSHYPPLNPDQPALIGQLYSPHLASEVKLALMNLYPDEHLVTLVTAAGLPEEKIITRPLYELDRQEGIQHLTSLYIPPLSQPSSLQAFQEVVAHLRAPDGCPWDREQTHESLRPYLLEEAYEVLAALDREDTAALSEELGDLLLQILLHTQIAAEGGEFKMPDVVSKIVAKLKRRHPHVFGDVQVSGAAEVLVNWEKIKEGERKEKAAPSLLGDVPLALPALARAQAIQERAARVGFDWPNIDGVVAKIGEEAAELVQAPADRRIVEEVGDLLFSLVNLARWLHTDTEATLRMANERFVRRFQAMERLCAERGMKLSDLSAAEQDQLWERVKSAEENR